jgi:hypothetical protein
MLGEVVLSSLCTDKHLPRNRTTQPSPYSRLHNDYRRHCTHIKECHAKTAVMPRLQLPLPINCNNVTPVLYYYRKIPNHLGTSPIINVWQCEFKRAPQYHVEQVNLIPRTPTVHTLNSATCNLQCTWLLAYAKEQATLPLFDNINVTHIWFRAISKPNMAFWG